VPSARGAQLFPELVTGPFTKLPENSKPPVLSVTARDPEIVLLVKVTPPLLLVTDALPGLPCFRDRLCAEGTVEAARWCTGRRCHGRRGDGGDR
jgi:hypothetical protein